MSLLWADPPATVTAQTASAVGGTRVLVTDDLLLDRRLVGRILEEQGGREVAFAGNGVEALAAVKREPIVEQRLQQFAYRSRKLRLFATVIDAEASFVIFDEGSGFDPSALSAYADASDLEGPSVRGTLLMRTHMDRVIYNPTGRQVTLIKRREQKEGRS